MIAEDLARRMYEAYRREVEIHDLSHRAVATAGRSTARHWRELDVATQTAWIAAAKVAIAHTGAGAAP